VLAVNFVSQNMLVIKSLLELKASLLYDAKKNSSPYDDIFLAPV